MSVFYPSRFAGISWFRVFLALGIGALVFSGCVLHKKMVHYEDIDAMLRNHIRYKWSLTDGEYTPEETRLVLFLASTVLQERSSQETYILLFILSSAELYGGFVLEMAGTTERKEIGASFFSRLLDSGEAEIAFVAYVFWFDWLIAEKEGLCSREETDEALRSLVDSFDADSPSETLSLGLNSLQKLKSRVESSEVSFVFTWPASLLDPERPFSHKSCFPRREVVSDNLSP